MSSKVTKITKSSKTVVEATRDSGGAPEAGDTKTALLLPSGGEPENGKNGSHDQTNIPMEYADGERTPDEGSKATRKLSHIKQRVSQEFTQSSRCRNWVKWLIHLVGATMPYTTILMGAIYRDECPANRNIPIHLIVTGVLTAILHLSTSIDMHRRLSYLTDKEKPAILTLLSVFLFVWMILGCVWTYRLFTPDYDAGTWNEYGYGARYCNYHLYWFAFVINTVALVSFVLSWIACCCICNLLCNISILTCLCVSAIKNKRHDEGAVQV